MELRSDNFPHDLKNQFSKFAMISLQKKFIKSSANTLAFELYRYENLAVDFTDNV